MHSYKSNVPDIVGHATALADELHFENSCSVDTGHLLRLLAGHCNAGKIAEIGTGCGVGTAWMVSAMPSTAELFSIDIDEARASAASILFREYQQVRVLAGDWRQLNEFGPFNLIFVDVGDAKASGAEDVLRMLKPGGIVLLDDLTPEELWPPEWVGKPDPVREFWLSDPRLAAVEVRTTPSSAVILATNLPG